MNKFLSAIFALAVTTTLALNSKVEADTSVQFGIGYRSDDINWRVQAPEEVSPKTETHLNFRDIEIFTLQGKLKGVCGDCVYYRADGQYGWILDGTVRESGQFATTSQPDCGTTIVFGSTHNDIKRNYVADFNIAVGYPLQQCWCPCLQVVPTLGFGYDTQRLRQKHHDRFDDRLPHDCSPLDSDHHEGHSKYRFTFWGPFVGLDLALCHQECWNLYTELQYHFGTRARRERNSHIGDEFFDHYERTKRAYGVSLKFGSTYAFNCNLFADAYVTYKRFTSHQHHDSLSWRSIGIALDLGYIF
jgi:hypothetical protein